MLTANLQQKAEPTLPSTGLSISICQTCLDTANSMHSLRFNLLLSYNHSQHCVPLLTATYCQRPQPVAHFSTFLYPLPPCFYNYPQHIPHFTSFYFLSFLVIFCQVTLILSIFYNFQVSNQVTLLNFYKTTIVLLLGTPLYPKPMKIIFNNKK